MQFITTVNWWKANAPQGENSPEQDHEEALNEAAFERITEQLAEGMTSGELNADIEVDGVETIYRGHWSHEIVKQKSEPEVKTPEVQESECITFEVAGGIAHQFITITDKGFTREQVIKGLNEGTLTAESWVGDGQETEIIDDEGNQIGLVLSQTVEGEYRNFH